MSNLIAFITPLGLNKIKSLPIGLASAPGVFQNLMKLIFAVKMAIVYLDDVIVFRRNFDEHLKLLELNFQRLAENGLKIEGSKNTFLFLEACQLLRAHYVQESSQGRPRENKKIRPLETMKEPSTLKYVRAFLGLVGYHRIFFRVSEKQQNIVTGY